MSVIARLLPDNPVLTKEMRVRMRGARAYWILFVYLGVLALLLWFQYYGWLHNVTGSGSGGSDASRIGAEIFQYMVITQMFLVFFITPAITSGALTIEREQQTMDMLTLTRIPRRSIIAGKLGAAVLFTGLLIVSSLPLISVCFMLGSVDPMMLTGVYLSMLMGSLLIGALGLMWSGLAPSTAAAVLYSYFSLLLMLVIGSVAFAAGFPGMSGGAGFTAIRAVTAVWFGNHDLGAHSGQAESGVQGVGFDILCALAALLLSAMAMARLEIAPGRKAGIIRLFTLLLIGVQVYAVDYWWVSAWFNRGAGAVMGVTQPPAGVLIVTAALLMFMVPVFTTGEIQPFEARNFGRYLLQGWTLKQLGRGKLSSGMAFMFLAALFCLALYPLSFIVLGQRASIFTSTRAAIRPGLPPTRSIMSQLVGWDESDTAVPAGPRAGAKPAPVPAPVGDFPQAAVAILASVIGFSLFCMFLSAVFRNRWVAWLIATVGFTMSWIVSGVSEVSESATIPASGYINLHYLNPAQAVMQITDPAGYTAAHWLACQNMPMWIVTTRLWLLIGLLSLVATLPFVRREARRNRPIPYEELVADA